MERDIVVSIDLAKEFVHVYAADVRGQRLFDRRVRTNKLFDTVVRMRPSQVVMEACGSAHYWGRRFSETGALVKLIPPQFVRPFRMGEKNDANDAMAIFEASKRPKLHPVAIKTEAHQVVQLWIRKRESLIESRTELINSTRAYLLELGSGIPKGVASFLRKTREILATNSLNPQVLEVLERDLKRLKELQEEVNFYEGKIKQFNKKDPLSRKLQTVEGVGPITAAALRAMVVNPQDFKNGRRFAAYLGLVPRQHSSGGKTRLFGIAKDGNRYLRQLLIHGGRSFLWSCVSKEDPKSQWANRKRIERGFNKACVAVANKNARTLWALMAQHQERGLVA